MKYFLVILSIPLFLFCILSAAAWGFKGATELAIKDKVILYEGKIYSVLNTGETYSTGAKEK